MKLQSAGIHHITAFAGSPQEIVDFYGGILGLRLIKKTVNHDQPEIYHLYFGNETGDPGTAITFFPDSGNKKGRIGGGQVGYITFAVPGDSLNFWRSRLTKFGVDWEVDTRFGETFLRFKDTDGLQLEIVQRRQIPASTWSSGGVPAEHAIKGFAGAVLFSVKPAETVEALQGLLGFEPVAREGDYYRFGSSGHYGNLIDVWLPELPRGGGGAGVVHHIAWRSKNDGEHSQWRDFVKASGFEPTPIIDRYYFQSIYFREHGGILFEIATDGPGFTVDEPLEKLGEKLVLPPWHEKRRKEIEQGLEPIEVRV